MDDPLEASEAAADDEGLHLLDVLVPLAEHFKLLVFGPLLVGALALGITYLIPPTFTATTVFLPPQQQQSAAASALASLGALSSLAGAAGAIKSPADQYVSLLRSTTVTDRLIDEFGLMKIYDVEYRFQARKLLAGHVDIALGKKDGLITVQVDDKDPKRAADLANRHVDALRRVTADLALTEAQQRRAFFEIQLKQTRDKLTAAQQDLQASGFNPGVLRAEPKAAAEGYARLKGETTAAEVRLQTLRRSLADNTPEVQNQQALFQALRAQLEKLESQADAPKGGDYLGKYREFKYQETLFELFARQYELARLDESREGALIQVVDPATTPEYKARPKRALTALGAAGATALFLLIAVMVRFAWRSHKAEPAAAEKLARLRRAWQGHSDR